MTQPAPEATPPTRPRVEGEREREILEATLEVLAEVGYDRLTMDAVATAARASKATLYRRWSSKAALAVEALAHAKGTAEAPDTGTLRGDLLELHCGHEGLTRPANVRRFDSVITAIATDPEFAEAFREQVVGPKLAQTTEVYRRAQARGEVRADLDLDLLAPALAGILLHRSHLLGEVPDRATVSRVVDQIILPAALAPSHRDRPQGAAADSSKG